MTGALLENFKVEEPFSHKPRPKEKGLDVNMPEQPNLVSLLNFQF